MAICIFILVLAYMQVSKNNLENNPVYVKGISLGLNKGARGNYYLTYTFNTDDGSYTGSVKRGFCDQCPACCIKGDTVLVRYENNNPKNNDLVTKFPAGVVLR